MRFVIALPNRSTAITSPSTPPSVRRVGSGVRRMTGCCASRPSASRSFAASERRGRRREHVATVERGRRRSETAARSTTRAPATSNAGESTPLSGPTRNRPSLATARASARRSRLRDRRRPGESCPAEIAATRARAQVAPLDVLRRDVVGDVDELRVGREWSAARPSSGRRNRRRSRSP